MAYWDTSCLVKLYAPETDSSVLVAHVVNGATVVTGEITTVRTLGDTPPQGSGR